MIRVDTRSVRVQADGIVTLLRARRDAPTRRRACRRRPRRAARRGAAKHHGPLGTSRGTPPQLVDTRGGDVDQAMGAAVRAAWDPASSTLRGLAPLAGEAFARALAARLRSGRFVTNTPETLARKRARGRGATPV